MTSSKPKRIALLLLCIAFSTIFSYRIRRDFQGPLEMPDFAEIYYGVHCALRHQDPYNPDKVIQEFKAENPHLQLDPLAGETARSALAVDVNLPTAFLFALPVALLPWALAQNVWMLLGAAVLTLAAYLMWDLAHDRAPVICGALVAVTLANCEVLLTVGNMAGIAVGLGLIAVWCFLKNRYALAGVVLLAISLALKPHDAGLVWLFFLLAGGALRRLALKTLVAVGILALIAVIWITPVSPHWLAELRQNVQAGYVSGGGGVNAPDLSAATNRSADQVIDLQSAISIFKDDPHIYNPLSYLISGALVLAWAIAALRKRDSAESALLALAAIAALSLLPLYHRTHDAKILMLVIPACAVLWTGKGPRRWIALALTSAAILLTSDIPLLSILIATRGLPSAPSTVTAKLLDLVLLQPAPLILLAVGCFYLWVFLCYNPSQHQKQQADRIAPLIQLESATE